MVYLEYFTDNQGENYDKIEVVNSMNNFFLNVGPDFAANIFDQGDND